MDKPDFNKDQVNWIYYQIGEWYLDWKNKICDKRGGVHRIGFAKEELKKRICPTYTVEIYKKILDQDFE